MIKEDKIMRRAKMSVKFSDELNDKINQEASNIEARSEFSGEDAAAALVHAVEHYIYVGETEEAAWDKATDLAAYAAYLAREHQSNLMGMVGQLLYSQRHRAHRDCRL